MLEYDEIVVTLGGCSSVVVGQGVPEGSKLGPFAYPLTLARGLDEGSFGIGWGVEIPSCWQGYVWHGSGTPVPQLVEVLLKGLIGQLSLPSIAELSGWPDLEASASQSANSSPR